jgi:hypothetical protein
MPLPTIEVPKYKLKVPSTGKMITYRPFLVKEEKVLLQAIETGDGDETLLLESLFQLLENCIETKNIKVREFTNFDLEYMFLQLRAKSVGETVELSFKCQNPECKKRFEFECNISELTIKEHSEHTNKIQLSEDLGIIMKYPNLKDAMKLTVKNDADELFNLIAGCVESIYTKEEVFSDKDHTLEEFENFIGQLSPEYFKKIMNFFETMPSMENIIKATCTFCKEENNVTIKGIEDFFV